MRQEVRYQLWIAAAAGVIFFTHLGGPALFDMDEALYSTCAREMLERGDPIVPWFNGALFPEKPPLMFWNMMVGYEIFGTGEWAEWGARFFSAVMGVGTALAAFHLGRLLFNPRVGLWAGLITASTIIFTISARAATVDSALNFVTTLAFLLFVMGWQRGQRAREMESGEGRVERREGTQDGETGRRGDKETRRQGDKESGQWSVASGQGSEFMDHGIGDRGQNFVADNQQSTINNQQCPSPLSSLPSPLLPRPPSLNLLYAVPMYALIGLAVLGKGPVGMVLPLAAMGLFLMASEGWRNLLRSAWRMRPFTALLVLAAVAVPWYVWVGVRTDWEWPRRFFIDFNLRPFKQPILGHGDVSSFDRVMAIFVSFLYYFYQIPAVLVGFFPWAVFLGPTLVDTVQRLRGKQWAGDRVQDSIADNHQSSIINQQSLSSLPSSLSPRDGSLLAACWFGTWLVFWSICKTKLSHYMLPAYPALALLMGCFVDRWLTEKGTVPICAKHPEGRSGGHRPKVGRGLSPFPPWALRNAWISTILVGVGITISILILATIYMPGQQWLGLLGLILVAGGWWCWRESSGGRHQRAAIGFAVMSVAFLTAVFGFASLQVDKYQNARPMIAAIRADWTGKGDSPPIATYQFFRESTVFYAGHPVTRCETDELAGRSARSELARFLAESPRSYVITTDECALEIDKEFPGKFKRIFHQPRFLDPQRAKAFFQMFFDLRHVRRQPIQTCEMVVLRAGAGKTVD